MYEVSCLSAQYAVDHLEEQVHRVAVPGASHTYPLCPDSSVVSSSQKLLHYFRRLLKHVFLSYFSFLEMKPCSLTALNI